MKLQKILKLSCFFLLFFSIFTINAYAPWQLPAISIGDAIADDFPTRYPSLAVNSDGTKGYAIWFNDNKIVTAKFDKPTWAPLTPPVSTGPIGYYPQIVTNDAGDIAVAIWSENGGINASLYAGGTWTTSILEIAGSAAVYPAIALNSTGDKAYAIWTLGSGDIKASIMTGTSWMPSTIPSGMGAATDHMAKIATNSVGDKAVAIWSGSNGNVYVHTYNNQMSTWTTPLEQQGATTPAEGQIVNVAMNSADKSVIAYTQSYTGGFKRLNGAVLNNYSLNTWTMAADISNGGGNIHVQNGVNDPVSLCITEDGLKAIASWTAKTTANNTPQIIQAATLTNYAMNTWGSPLNLSASGGGDFAGNGTLALSQDGSIGYAAWTQFGAGFSNVLLKSITYKSTYPNTQGWNFNEITDLTSSGFSVSCQIAVNDSGTDPLVAWSFSSTAPFVFTGIPIQIQSIGNFTTTSPLSAKVLRESNVFQVDFYARLLWLAPSGFDAVSYNIYQNGVLVGTVPGSSLGYDAKFLGKNKSYTFTVVAVDALMGTSTVGSATVQTPKCVSD